MNSLFFRRWVMLWTWLGILVLAALLPVRSEDTSNNTKPIRLRTGVITTPVKRTAAPAAASPGTEEPAVSGLWLVQFNGRFQTEYRAPLAALGVEILHYIPDDTFIARLDNTKLSTLRALPYVRWVGAYEAKYKIDPRITRQLGVTPGGSFGVRILLRPGVSGLERVVVAQHLQSPTPLHDTHLGHVASGAVDGRRLFELAKNPAVIWIEPAARMRLFDAVATKIIMGDGDSAGSLAELHQLGFDGRGVVVAVADSGLDSGDVEILHPDLEGRVDALFAYGGLADASDEHGHGTHCAGIVAGDAATGEVDDDGELFGLGVAPGAHLVGQRIFDGNGDYFPPPTYETLTRDAVRSGAYVGSNSWGDDTSGQYDLSAAEFDALVRDADALTPGEQPYVLEFSAGNAGPGEQTIGSPAVAKNVIATGACQNNRFNLVLYAEGQEVMADFSSRGPCEDGRIKPDIVAPGTWIASLRSIFANDNNSWAPISDHYLYEGGTSQAGPHASGAAAVFVQWYRQTHGGQTPSPAMVKAGLINSADDMGTATIPDPTGNSIAGGVTTAANRAKLAGAPKPADDITDGIVVGDTAPVPNGDEGWGRINLVNLIQSDRRYDLLDQGPELRTEQTWEKRVVVGPDDQLKVTLVYTDVPALPAAIPALVNDLDLEVIAPDGSLYRGNAFSEGESIAGTPEGDRINNVEAVHVSLPTAGEWLVRVRAHNIVGDVHHRTNVPPQQDFALVISGALPLPGEGVISFDRPGYRAPGVATVRLTDFDLNLKTNVTVHVASSREPGGFDLVMTRPAGGSAGSFVGTVALGIGVTNTVDQILQVADGDELTVTYQDASPAGERRAGAVVDLTAPTVANVLASPAFGRVTVTWLTGEPATGAVYYGTTNAVTNVVTTLGFAVDHKVIMPPLIPDTLYFFYLVCADAAGNLTTNTLPGGVYYRFTPPPPKTALLVYSPETLINEFTDSPYPGIETWTGPLDALGINYEIWNTAENDQTPSLEQLSQYRLVLWRPEELGSPAPGLTTALTRYVAGGGSLFVSSYDLISRLTQPADLTFRTNVLHLASFDEDQGATAVKAVAGDPVGGTLNVTLDYSEFPSGLLIELLGIVWEDGPDHLRLMPDAAASLTQEDGRVVGMRYPKTGADSRGRVVFWSFAFEAIPATGDLGNNRTEALARAVAFLLPDLQSGSSVAFDQSAYTVPANVIVEVADARRSADATVSLAVKVGDQPEQTLTLSATTQKGVFRGRATLLAPPGVNAPGRFLATNGNLVTAIYLDAANRSLVGTATVDTVPPVITEIGSDPAYNEATLMWTTDKDADALVRYGESGGDDSFLTKTAYNAELAQQHEVQIRGLLPDKTYYFEVVSRDAAGNVTRDNRGGKYHTVRTLTPLKPPVRDDLEKGREGYAVFNDNGGTGSIIGDEGDDSDVVQLGWEYGVPENAHAVTAHSGTNCWATNLKGNPTDFAISDLITPAISLVGGNQATLRFWQNFDFTQSDSGTGDDSFGGGDLIQAAQLAVSTDNGANWTSLYTPDTEASDGWEEVTVDISHYVGSTVRFRFNYQLFSFNTIDRLGWLIDDLAVDLNVVASSRVVVSNNLAQASFLLTGTNTAAGGNGRIWSTNIPPGDYAIRWLDVPYYLTPAPQTNHLGSTTNALVFVGNYQFPDLNHNGISDLWETRFFGGLSPLPAWADHDGDGVSDLQEFYAGTNPTNAASALRVSLPQELPNRTVRLTWPSTAGREYRLEGSQDLEVWSAYSESVIGIGGIKSVVLPALDPKIPYFFRVTVRP